MIWHNDCVHSSSSLYLFYSQPLLDDPDFKCRFFSEKYTLEWKPTEIYESITPRRNSVRSTCHMTIYHRTCAYFGTYPLFAHCILCPFLHPTTAEQEWCFWLGEATVRCMNADRPSQWQQDRIEWELGCVAWIIAVSCLVIETGKPCCVIGLTCISRQTKVWSSTDYQHRLERAWCSCNEWKDGGVKHNDD